MLALAPGILVSILAVALAAAARRAPAHRHCPSCGEDTRTVQPPSWLRRRLAGRIDLRWCPACGWEGPGRAGPEWVPGHPIAHGSGFFWGEQRMPVDFGFRFATAHEATPGPERPHHPSGFRFAAPAGRPDGARAHPSGFHWGSRPQSVGRISVLARSASGRTRDTAFEWGQAG